ncbi:hypothetical protein ACIPEN_22310 [Herbaspirillum chlorophenolicum]|uniref:Terminase small subunit n=1 Tax=Herbaspirillum chlorophenolicum TaxID=211589 RepID=A0ABW8F5K2_9BURK
MAKKRNKAYRPRGTLVNPLDWAIAGAHTMTDLQQSEFLAPVDRAIDLIRQGKAGRDDWNDVANAMNVATALAHFQIGPNLLPAIEAAQDALKAVAGRMIGGGSSTCYAHELEAIREGREMYRAQLKVCTQGESSRAIQRVKNMHRSGAMEDMAKLFAGMQSINKKQRGERNENPTSKRIN